MNPQRARITSPGLRSLDGVPFEGESIDRSATAANAGALRIVGYTQREIAVALCVTESKVTQWLREARERAELLDVGPLMDHIAVPQAVDNLIDGLRAGNEKFTLATLGGRGVFSQHSKNQTTVQETRLEIQVIRRTDSDTVPMQSQIVGVPREVIDAVPERTPETVPVRETS